MGDKIMTISRGVCSEGSYSIGGKRRRGGKRVEIKTMKTKKATYNRESRLQVKRSLMKKEKKKFLYARIGGGCWGEEKHYGGVTSLAKRRVRSSKGN